MIRPECLQCGQRVGWIGIGANFVMVVMKITVGLSAGSRACLADALHSSTNIVTAFAIFISRKLTGKPIDENHPYGHGKIEFIAAGAVSVIIMVLTITLVATSLEHILYKPVPPPHLTAGVVALISIIINEILFRYFRCVGTELRSQTIIANAWANRADCFSSLAVVVGVVGARFGFHHLDPIAAVLVAGIIVKVCVSCIRESIAGLMDRNVSNDTISRLNDIVHSMDEIQKINHIRARLMGNQIWVDVSVQVAESHTVHHCERIRSALRKTIQNEVQEVGEIFVDFESVPEA